MILDLTKVRLPKLKKGLVTSMNYHNITHDDMLNGEGLRVVLWVSGCGHHCPECQNPETHDINSGIPFDEEAKAELFEYLSKDYIQGITFSGGDPLNPNNRQVVGDLIREIRNTYPNKDIWLYTGYLWEQVQEIDFISLIDVMCDGRFIMCQKDSKLHWVGSSNQRVIDISSTIKHNKVILHEDK